MWHLNMQIKVVAVHPPDTWCDNYCLTFLRALDAVAEGRRLAGCAEFTQSIDPNGQDPRLLDARHYSSPAVSVLTS